MTKEDAMVLLCEHFSEGLVRTIVDALSRKWVGLTDDDELDWKADDSLIDLFKAIEAKLKEKNGY